MTNTKLAAAEWHTLDADSVLQELQSSGSGLGSVDAAERLTLHGANRLPEKSERGVLVRFLRHFRNILFYVPFIDGLLIAGVGATFFAIIEVGKQLRLSFYRDSSAGPGLRTLQPG